jgi:hypothetical protein
LEERVSKSRWINPEGNHITGILFDEENNPEYVLYGIPAGHLSLPPLAEEPFCAACEEAAPSLSYYEENEVEIGKVFDKGVPESVLETAIPDSSWVRVEDCGACYVMGIIREGEKPLYICYGVPSHYTEEPPQGMAEYCQWLPASAALPKEEGYWMMYQDAITGRTVAP